MASWGLAGGSDRGEKASGLILCTLCHTASPHVDEVLRLGIGMDQGEKWAGPRSEDLSSIAYLRSGLGGAHVAGKRHGALRHSRDQRATDVVLVYGLG